MQQLPLDVSLADYARFESFFVGPNSPAVHAATEAAHAPTRALIWLCGGEGVGKTHLLQAIVTAGTEHGFRAAYLPLGPESNLPPAAADGLGELDLICIDDVDAVAADADWERALFALFESARESGARLVLAAAQAPAHSAFALRDLVSRFSSAAVFRLHQLSDAEKLEALRFRAAWRGFALPDDVVAYLIKRVDRSTSTLFGLLDKLDHEGLVAKKKISIALVKSVLNA